MPNTPRVRTSLIALILVLCGLIAPAVASADTQTIPGDRVRVSITDTGQYQAAFTSPQFGSTRNFFYPPGDAEGSSGFWLRFTGGPLSGQLFGASSVGGAKALTPVSNQVTGNFTPSSPGLITTVYDVVDEGTSYARVTQETRYVNTESRFRITWKVQNLLPATPQSFRASTGADLYVDGDDSGTGFYTGSTPRFIGGTNAASRAAGGAEEVLSSQLPGEATATPIAPWSAFGLEGFGTIFDRIGSTAGFQDQIVAERVDNGAGVQWDDHNTGGTPLPGSATARYEIVWKLRQPLPLDLSPRQSTPELPAGGGQATKEITATVRDTNGVGVPGQTVRWALHEGSVNGPQSGVVRTGSQGEAAFTVRGLTAGVDTVDAYVDVNANGSREEIEPGLSTTITWLAHRDVGQPAVQAPALPGGGTLSIGTQSSPDDPRVQYFTIPRGQISQYPEAPDGGRTVNLPISVPIAPGAGTVSGVSLLALDPGDDPNTAPEGTTPANTEGTLYRFVLASVRRSDLYVRYTLTENGVSQTFTIPIGQIVLIDPQGVVYDQERYDALVAAGTSADDARRQAAITGATVRLQRRLPDGSFANVLSGDPGIAPNVNPQITQADGRYQWDVAEGVYRVAVTAPGFADATSQAVTIPPPVLDLHVGLRRPVVPVSTGPGTSDPGTKVDPPAQTSPPATTTPVVTPPATTTVAIPRISGLSAKPARFRPAGRAGAAARAGGTQLQIRLTTAAKLQIVLERRVAGRRAGKSCVKPTRKNAKAKRCDRFQTVTTQNADGTVGANVLRITGRVRGKALKAGAYRVRVRATAGGRTSPERTVKLTVLAEKVAKKAKKAATK